MKKLFLFASLLMASVVYAFTPSAEFSIKMTSANGDDATIVLTEEESLSDAFDNGFDVENPNKVGLYIVANGITWLQWGTNNLDGVQLGVTTNTKDNEYVLNFFGVEGTEYIIVDAQENKRIPIVEGGSYTFTAEANQTINNRFSIAKNIPAKFINNQLVINDAAAGAEVNVTPFSFVEGRRVDGTKVTYNAPVNQALNGNYFEVEYTNNNGVARKFIVNANPDVQPAN